MLINNIWYDYQYNKQILKKIGVFTMAIVTTNFEKNGRKLIKHESDSDKMIRQVETGREYSSAIDVIPCRYTYEETDKDVPKYPERGVKADEA